jgi:large conductance mechanosensitive channel
MLKEFKEFALRGNVLDMAVGIIIGAAFGKIVSSFVKDVVMPPIGKLLGGVDFSALYIMVGEGTAGGPYEDLAAAQADGAVTINYGVFLNTVIDFVIVAFVIFMVIRTFNKLKKQEEAPPAEPTTKDCPKCFTEISIKATRCPHCTSEIQAA